MECKIAHKPLRMPVITTELAFATHTYTNVAQSISLTHPLDYVASLPKCNIA